MEERDDDRISSTYACFDYSAALADQVSISYQDYYFICFSVTKPIRSSFQLFSMAIQKDNSSPLLTGLLHQSNRKESLPTVRGRGRRRRSFSRSKSEPISHNNHLSTQTASILTNIHPSFIKVSLFLFIYLTVGATCFYAFRSKIQGNDDTNGIVDILYYCVVTMTTVGYGDLVPDTAVTKLLACAFVFSGMALVALVLSKAADYLVEKQETLLFKAFHLRGGDKAPTRVKYKCFMIGAVLLVLMAVGTAVLIVVEGKDAVDAFYCVCCTITTLGYGDESFLTRGGRAFAVLWILTSTVCLGQFFLYVAEMNTESRQRELVRWVLGRRVTYQDLEAADLNGDGVVEPAEFIVYKLKEMGKISEEDVSMVMQEFEELDVDQSGTISVSDIILAQSDIP
ncbi:hypothetical protein V2J09_018299 [Rumex salicifolius]